jgi:hypothetical protein
MMTAGVDFLGTSRYFSACPAILARDCLTKLHPDSDGVLAPSLYIVYLNCKFTMSDDQT